MTLIGQQPSVGRNVWKHKSFGRVWWL